MAQPRPGGDGGRKGFDTRGTDVGSTAKSGERRIVLQPGARVCIIGGGSCGIYTCRTLREAGLDPVVFEQSHGVAGVWRSSGKGGVAYDCLRTNSSDVITTAPCFPMPQTSTPFPHHTEISSYIEAYATHFDLLKHVQFNTQVVAVAPLQTPGDPQCPRWRVAVRRLKSDAGVIWQGGMEAEMAEDAEHAFEFDAVYICTGQYGGGGVWPELPGRENFTGTIMHSLSYRRNSEMAGKHVVVVGIGNSALDLALDTSAVAAGVFVAVRRSSSLIVAVDDELGRPIDMFMHTRANLYGPRAGATTVMDTSGRATGSQVPVAADTVLAGGDAMRVMKAMMAAGLPPPAPLSQSQLGQVKDRTSVLKRISEGKIRFGPGIQEVKERSVVLADGREIPADSIICCTGYDLLKGLDFIHSDVYGPLKRRSPGGRPWLDLYKMMLPPNHRTLIFCGMITTDANEALVGEMQARWATAMLMGHVDWPSNADVLKYCRSREQRVQEVDPAYTRFVRYVPYMDDLARDIGCLPELPPMPPAWHAGAAHVATPTTEEERYVFNLWFGPTVPSHWRLSGPHRWTPEEARKYVLGKLQPGLKTPAPEEPVSWAPPLSKM